MNDQLISFDTALLAKSKGFFTNYGTKESYQIETKKLKNTQAISCLGNNKHNDIAEAPTQSLLQKWLREKHKMIIVIDWEGVDGFLYKLNFDSFYDVSGNNSKSYEDCLEIALYECLQRVSETVA